MKKKKLGHIGRFLKNLKKIQPSIKYVKGFKTLESIVTVRDKYGAHKIKANDLLLGIIPSADTAVYKITYFRKIAKATNNKYNYKKTRYNGLNKVVTVTCPEHGDFTIQAKVLLKGDGCIKCKTKKPRKNAGYSKSDFVETASGRTCTLYAIRCTDDYEEFYKIGITSRSVEQRFSYENSMPYDYSIVHEIQGEASEIWELEKEMHRIHKEHRYKPKKYFSGITECFSELKMKHNGKRLWKSKRKSNKELTNSAESSGKKRENFSFDDIV